MVEPQNQPANPPSQPRAGLRWITRRAVLRLTMLAIGIVLLLVWSWQTMIRMPGRSHTGALPPATAAQKALAAELESDVRHLAEHIGDRHLDRYDSLRTTAEYLSMTMMKLGYSSAGQQFTVEGKPCVNVVGQRTGIRQPDRIVIVGAHYDSVAGSPGANDNASGVAAVLALARRFAGHHPGLTLRLAFFVNEEPPYFQTSRMGSYAYALRCRHYGEDIAAMISFDGIGFYTDEPATQQYPSPMGMLYPDAGNFIAIVGNTSSSDLVKRLVGSFRGHAAFPSEGAALPGFLPGVGWSDHWSFWQTGYQAVMVTDTLPFRYAHYHSHDDTPDKLDFDRMARVVEGMSNVIADLADMVYNHGGKE